MSLIHTCELNGVASLGYLIALQKHAREVAEQPAAWMPWNYRDTLAQAAQALQYVHDGHTEGKVILALGRQRR